MHRNITWLSACFMLHADLAWAHPGHGVSDPAGPAHYVLEPLHSLPIVLIALGIVGVCGGARLLRTAGLRRDDTPDE